MRVHLGREREWSLTKRESQWGRCYLATSYTLWFVDWPPLIKKRAIRKTHENEKLHSKKLSKLKKTEKKIKQKSAVAKNICVCARECEKM